MKKKTGILLLALVMVLSFTMSACAPKTEPAPSADQEPSEKIVRVSLDGEPVDLDPQVGTDLGSIMVTGHVLEGLVRVYDGKVLPGMAEKWEISPDGLTYTFHLRDAKWSDGVPVKAKDFEYSIIRLLDPNTAGGYTDVMGFYIKNAEKFFNGEVDKSQVGVKALDEKTVEITLENPTGYFLRLLGFMPYWPSRQDIIEKYGDSFASDPDKMVYNGPFVIESWKHEDTIVLSKNDGYWDKDKVKLDKIEMPFVVDSKTAINMFETGTLDSSAIPADMLPQFEEQGTAKFMPNGGVFWLQFNFSDKRIGAVLKNANFRKAISYSLDREAFAKNVIQTATPATRYVPSIIMGMDKKYAEENPYDVLPLKADQAKAKEYFDKALKELNLTADKFPAITLLCTDAASTRTAVEAIQDMVLKSIGVKLDIRQVPSKARLQAVKERDYEIVYANWFPDYDDPMTYLDVWVTGGGFNRSDYSNKAFDEAIKAAKSATDEKVRYEKMFEAEKIYLEDLPAIPTHWGANVYVQSDRLVNYTRSLVGADPDLVYTDVK